MTRDSKEDINNWKFFAIAVLKDHGGSLHPQTLGDLTGVSQNTAIMRARKFDKTFKITMGLSDRSVMVAKLISLCQGL